MVRNLKQKTAIVTAAIAVPLLLLALVYAALGFQHHIRQQVIFSDDVAGKTLPEETEALKQQQLAALQSGGSWTNADGQIIQRVPMSRAIQDEIQSAR